jgi:amino acid adenylation domain-containing protein
VTVDFLDSPVANWSARKPNNTAVRFQSADYSFAALDRAANSVAGHLVAKGVVPGDRVAIYAAKSFHTIAAVLGVLRVGAAYVPIDPAAPEERIFTILSDCSPKLVLTEPARTRRLPEYWSHSLLNDAVDAQPISKPAIRTPDDLAYILYTSGSTGTPKGICHTHRSGMAYAQMSAKLCALGPEDRVTHLTPLHFDMSIFDIFATLGAGATVVVIPEAHAKLPASLTMLVSEEQVTVWYSVPFAIAQILDRGALETRDMSSLRLVMFAGETIPPKILGRVSKVLPKAQLFNAYGPTETNHCTTAQLRPDQIDGVSAVPIGQADDGVVARVSKSGELLIASDQVMTGYWNDPVRTNAAFETLTHSGQSRRFYRTGDLVTCAVDGTFSLIGRADRQVKLRGHRVELDEVELVLSYHPLVREAAVVLTADGHSLHAFISGDINSVNSSDLAMHVAAWLPTYCVPAEFTCLTALARTSTGKIDRNAMVERNVDRNAA